MTEESNDHDQPKSRWEAYERARRPVRYRIEEPPRDIPRIPLLTDPRLKHQPTGLLAAHLEEIVIRASDLTDIARGLLALTRPFSSGVSVLLRAVEMLSTDEHDDEEWEHIWREVGMRELVDLAYELEVILSEATGRVRLLNTPPAAPR